MDQTALLDHARALEFIKPILAAYQAEDVFSPKEKVYLDNPDSTQNEQIQFAWPYENLWVVEWALGLTDELPWPDRLCDVSRTVKELEQAVRLRLPAGTAGPGGFDLPPLLVLCFGTAERLRCAQGP